MPYNSNRELPERVKSNLPDHAQDIFREAFNNAYEEYEEPEKRRTGSDREETAMRVAWSAVKEKYIKDNNGQWVKK